MLVPAGSMFHQDAVKTAFDMRSGFHEAGLYILDRPELDGMLKVKFNDQADYSKSPVALIVHGYRGSPDGPNNSAYADVLRGHGFATAQIGFAGYDHYGQDSMPQAVDLATIPSNIEDVKLTLKAIGADRPVLMVASCAGINIVVPAANANVSHILAVSPLPNIVSVVQAHMRSRKLSVVENGYVISPDNVMWKVTDTFIRAGQPIHFHRQADLQALKYKPKLKVVRSIDDPVSKSGFVQRWLRASLKAGYDVEDIALPGSSHGLTELGLETFSQQVLLVQRDLGMR